MNPTFFIAQNILSYSQDDIVIRTKRHRHPDQMTTSLAKEANIGTRYETTQA